MDTSRHLPEIPESEIRLAVNRVAGSPMFVMSERLCRFLRFAVETSLSGQGNSLKESLIGAEVYDRSPAYDPSQDSIVRTEARRLRRKLEDYYHGAGKADPILIEFPVGAYAPRFSRRAASDAPAGPLHSTNGVADLGPKIGVAVIPVADMSGSALSANLSQNLTEELTHTLAHTAGLRIAAATSSQLAAQPTDIPSLAEKLDVEFLLEGSVREADGRARVAIRVVMANGFQIWSQLFEVGIVEKQLFQIAERIASAMISRVRPEQSSIRMRNAATESNVVASLPIVYGGEALLDHCTTSDRQAAMAKFQEAARIAPSFARVHCGMAQYHCESALSGIPDSAASVAAARQAAAHALKLDPQMIGVQQSMACVLALEGQTEEARAGFLRALEIGAHAGGHREYGLFLTAQGQFEEAWYHLDQAQQIDPFSQRQKLACAKFFQLTNRLDDAVAHFAENGMFGSLPAAAELCLAAGHSTVGNAEAARRIVASVRKRVSGQPQVLAVVAECLARAGDLETAAQITESHRLADAGGPLSHFRQALLQAAFGRLDEAARCLRRSAEENEAECLWMQVDPRFSPLRSICSELFGPADSATPHR